MQRIARILALALAGTSASATGSVHAQQQPAGGVPVTGYVADQFGQPVVNAEVVVLDSAMHAGVRTGAAGAYRLEGLAPGSHLIRVRRVGYLATTAEVVLRAGDTQVRDWELRRLPESLNVGSVQGDDGELRAGLQAFQHRQQSAAGSFIDRDEIERRRPRYARDLLRGVSGFRLTGGGAGDAVLWSAPGGGAGAGCRTPMYVEGLPYVPATGVDDFAPDDIEAIELYPPGAAVAGQVNAGNGSCGAVLIWLRR